MKSLLLRRRTCMAMVKPPYDAEIQYLRTTNRSRITTDYVPKGDNIVIKAKVKFENYYGGDMNGWFGNYKDGSSNFFGIRRTSTSDGKSSNSVSNNSRGSDGGTAHTFKVNPSSSNTFYTIELSKTTLIVNGGTPIQLTNVAGNENNYPIALFIYCPFAKGTASGCMVGNIYYFKVEDNGVTVLDLIPVRVGTVGYMYDKVSKKMYGNVGPSSSNFTLGPDVS